MQWHDIGRRPSTATHDHTDNTCGATTATCAGGDDDEDDGLIAADDVVEGDDGDGALGEEEMAALLARLNVRF